MGGINVKRWLIGGVAAAVVMFVVEGIAGSLYQQDMAAAMAAHGLSMTMDATGFALSAVYSLLAGLVLIFWYAAVRPRFGAGPKTALIVGVAGYLGGYLLWVLAYQFLGLFPASMLSLWAVVGFVEYLLAAQVGAWLYRED